MDSRLWSPLSLSNQVRPRMVKAEGVYLFDENDDKYIDLNSGLWNVNIGYSNPEVTNAVCKQVKQLQYLNPYEFSSDSAETLSNLIIENLPSNMEKCIFTCTGSESNELAIKIIRKYHSLKLNSQKNTIACIKHSYHGSYYGAMSLSSYDREMTCGYGPLLANFIELSLPFSRNDDEKGVSKVYINTLKEELLKYKDILAGIVIEPILGSAGVVALPDNWLNYLIEFCHENDILVVFDEVATGFGRTGNMFYSEKFVCQPDMICLSKGINNGVLPLGALGVSKKISSLFEQHKEIVFHLSTQNCNPICCESAIASINVLKNNNCEILCGVTAKGELFENLFTSELSNCLLFHSVRRVGLMIAIELNEIDGQPLEFENLMLLRNGIFKKRLIVEWSWIKNVTSCLVLFPSFIMSENIISEVVKVVSSEIKKLEKRMTR